MAIIKRKTKKKLTKELSKIVKKHGSEIARELATGIVTNLITDVGGKPASTASKKSKREALRNEGGAIKADSRTDVDACGHAPYACY